MAAEALTHAAFLDEVVERMEGDVSKADIKKVVAALSEELGDCLANGYKVSISGIGIFEPRAKKGRKKGTMVRNPFDGTEKKIKADEPDKVTIKARPAAGLKNALPDPKKADGIALAKKLLKKKR